MRKMTTFYVLISILTLLLISLVLHDIAGAAYYSNHHWIEGQECYNITIDDYEYYDACFPIGDDGRLGSDGTGYAHFNNASTRFENVYGIVDPKFMMYSPLSMEKLKTPEFAGEMKIETKIEDEKDIKIKELQRENDLLKQKMQALVEETVRKAMQDIINQL